MKEIRSADVTSGEELVITGTPIVFDVPTVIHDPNSSYTEIIKRGALDHCDLSDVTLRIEHQNQTLPLARTPKTLQLEVRDDGLHMTAHLAESRRDVYESIVRGDVRGMSFAFVVGEGGSSFDARSGIRTITSISKVYECSICTNPCYPQTSVSAEARSQMQAAKDNQADRDEIICRLNQLLLEIGH